LFFNFIVVKPFGTGAPIVIGPVVFTLDGRLVNWFVTVHPTYRMELARPTMLVK
jgi:hypothetical protein